VAKALAALLALALLAGCGDQAEPRQGDYVSEQGPYVTTTTVRMPDGRTVPCVVYRPGNGGGISCDWTAR